MSEVELVLKNLIKLIDQEARDRGFVRSSLYAPAHTAQSYFRGTLKGMGIAKDIISNKLKEYRNDSNSDQAKKDSSKVQPL